MFRTADSTLIKTLPGKILIVSRFAKRLRCLIPALAALGFGLFLRFFLRQGWGSRGLFGPSNCVAFAGLVGLFCGIGWFGCRTVPIRHAPYGSLAQGRLSRAAALCGMTSGWGFVDYLRHFKRFDLRLSKFPPSASLRAGLARFGVWIVSAFLHAARMGQPTDF
jgi:hypothetical protein